MGDHHFQDIVKNLAELVSYQSLAFQGYDRQQLLASADAVADLFSQAGLDDLHQLTETNDEGASSGPAIIGRKHAKDNKPTVMLYAHHDVQPSVI